MIRQLKLMKSRAATRNTRKTSQTTTHSPSMLTTCGRGGKIGESGSEIIKIAVDRDGNPIMSEVKTYSFINTSEYEASPLAGCSFALYKVDANGNKTGDPIEAESDAAGRIKFEGLDAGKYILVETEAPAGYVKDNTEYPIVITAVTEEKSYTEYYDQDGNWYDDRTCDGTTAYTYECRGTCLLLNYI